jgi:hypothetical protein
MSCSEWLKLVSELCFDNKTSIAIAIQKVTEEQSHASILYHQKQDNRYHLLHLAWHCLLKDQPTTEVSENRFYYTNTQISTAIQASVRTLSSKVSRRYMNQKDGPEYGLESQPKSFFDLSSGEVKLGENASGLTCATFVLALLRSHYVHIIDYQIIPDRREDEQLWFELVIKTLENTRRATPEHIEKVRQSTRGAVRIRSEDVVCAAKWFDGFIPYQITNLTNEIDDIRAFLPIGSTPRQNIS